MSQNRQATILKRDYGMKIKQLRKVISPRETTPLVSVVGISPIS
ncbi:MAG: hypothetical protein V7L21_26535 [Nostoc sp.]